MQEFWDDMKDSNNREEQTELEKPEGLMVVFYHQLENHHHLMEALLVLWSGWGASEEGQGRGMAGGLWRSLGWGRGTVPGRS